MALRPECALFRGDKPCPENRSCDDCPSFRAFPTRILIVKCRAQGDVLRTTPLLRALKRKHPQSYISWLVDAESLPLLAANPYIDRLYAFDLESSLALLRERYDIVISLDKETGPAALATAVEAPRKLGFGLNEFGNLIAFNAAADYACRLGVDDELKFRLNRKTYQEIIHEAAELPFVRDQYVYALPDGAREKPLRFLQDHRVPAGKPAIGLNTGAGAKFATKQWPLEHHAKLASLLARRLGASVFLLGGPREREFNGAIAGRVRGRIYDAGTDNSLEDFAGFLDLMDVVVSSDSLGMHLAIALRKKVVALFGPTCPQEIDLYDRGVRLFAGADCAPCYKSACAERSCMKALTPELVFEEIRRLL